MLNLFGNCVASPPFLSCSRMHSPRFSSVRQGKAELVTGVRERPRPDLQILQDAFRHFAS